MLFRSINVVFGGAERQRRTGRAVDIRCAPGALTFVAMEIALKVESHALAQRRRQAHRGKGIAAQTRGIVIGVIDSLDRGGIDRASGRVERRGTGFAAIATNVSRQHRQLIVLRTEIVPIVTEPVDHLEREILIVLFGAVGIADIAVKRGAAERDHRLGIDHETALYAFTLPFTRVQIVHRGEGARAVGRANADAREAAIGVFRAIGRTGSDAQCIARVDREELERPAKVVGRLRVERS